MTDVKGVSSRVAETQVASQMGQLMQAIRSTMGAEDWGGLRQSHFRMLSQVPPDGITITELGDRLGMTKQASGQFVSYLTGTGHLRVRTDPADRRTRIAVRTRLGDRTAAAVAARIRRIEDDWAERVGVERYAQFRRILDDLVDAL